MAEKNVPVFITNEAGDRIQVAWSSPDNGTGVRSLNILEGYENVSLKDLEFGDVGETELDPKTTQAAPRTFEETVGQDFVTLEGEVIQPADPEVHWDPDAEIHAEEVTIPSEIPPVPSVGSDEIPQEGDEGKDSAPIQDEPNEELPPVENQPLASFDNDEDALDDDSDDDLADDPEWAALVAEDAAERDALEDDSDDDQK